ncbi:uncharacterized protein LOC126738951 [Anthonomus grandis grandis]|uniref:uncharacterized protein LOC126738951 n=1 Tax=Anthonomus grandis grandis TaxID=2921223 RepID=UPI002166939C|nr:uncharacterized protein LOC126738951 [Anthonomus grandis grandis]
MIQAMETVLKPPDGGYGWVIVFASVLNNFLMVPLIQNVVLIFKDKMELEIDMTTTQMWFALNVNTCFGQITALFNNLLLNRFGYRKVTLAGVTFVFFGLGMSSWIHNYLGFMITFGFVAALGVGLNTSSYTLAIKSYFVHEQNKAIGLSMTLTALGPILMPQIINLLIQNYHPDGVILILAGIIAHGYIGAILLQPVRWHMKKVPKTEENRTDVEGAVEIDKKQTEQNTLETNEVLDPLILPQQTGPARQYQLFPPREFLSNRKFPGFRRKDSIISINYEQENAAIMGLDSALGGSLYSLESVGQRRSSSYVAPQRVLTKTTWWKSEESVNLESCYNLFDDKTTESEHTTVSELVKDKHSNETIKRNIDFEEHMVYKELSFNVHSLPWYKSWIYQAVEVFGLDIFSDLRYVSIMIGISFAIVAEMNFTVLLPFLLFEYELTIAEIAAFLSLLGAADILFRFLAPHIGDCFRQPARVMIIAVLLVIILARFALIYVTHYPSILLIAVILGCVKGLRVVYMSLVIPSYVPKERLASASAIQIIANSLMSLLSGHFIGVTRTQTGSYIYCVQFLNCLTVVTIVMWSIDIIFKKFFRKKYLDEKGENLVEPTDVY